MTLGADFYQIVEEFDCEAERAIVSTKRIAFSWVEDGDECGATLSSLDGVVYEGTWGDRECPRIGTIEGWLFRAKDGDHIFWCTWINEHNGDELKYLIHFRSDSSALD